jgi:acyl dehydratase
VNPPTVHQRPPALTDLAEAESGARLAHLRWPGVTRTQLAFYCAAVGVTDPIHYDRGAAAEHGFADVVVNGSLRFGMAELAVTTLWPQVVVTELSCRHRGVLHVGEPVDAYVTLRQTGPAGTVVEVEHYAAGALVDTCTIRLATGLQPPGTS